MRLRLVRPCPSPEVVRGEHCDVCNTRVHDLTRSSDPAAEIRQLGGSACVRVLAAALVLGGCSGAVDLSRPASTQATPAASAPPDAGAPPEDDSAYLLGQVVETD